jgi:hypothetical protein
MARKEIVVKKYVVKLTADERQQLDELIHKSLPRRRPGASTLRSRS